MNKLVFKPIGIAKELSFVDFVKLKLKLVVK